MPPVIVRFAPSPTGYLHVGNARTALFNWLFAMLTGGSYILRLDDTDTARSRPEYAAAIEEDLAWLGITPERGVRQSDRSANHRAAAERLKAAGRLYPCWETPEELEFQRRRRLAGGQPPIYDRSALRLTAGRRAELVASGRPPHWRFLLQNYRDDPLKPGRREVGWTDLFRGPQTVDVGSFSDPVLVREDGSFPYTLTSVVDDIDLAISHVIRGDDHVTNTAVQIQIFEALGAAPPEFGHHNLLTDASGESLSKRTGSQSVASFRRAGYEPMAVASLAVLIGTSEAVEPAPGLAELARHFAPEKVSRAPARFDPAELDAVNARLLRRTGYADVAGRLAGLGVGGGEAFWDAVRGNLQRLAEAGEWWRIVSAPIDPAPLSPEDAAFVASAAGPLPPDPWGDDTWRQWTDALKTASGRKGRDLFRPLRLALTGREHGPEMARLLTLIGRRNTLDRLAASRPRP